MPAAATTFVILAVDGQQLRPVRRGVRAHGLLGPSFAVNLDAAIDNRVLPRSSLDDITASVRDLDAGLVLVGGVTLGPGVVVDGRYYLGALLAVPIRCPGRDCVRHLVGIDSHVNRQMEMTAGNTYGPCYLSNHGS